MGMVIYRTADLYAASMTYAFCPGSSMFSRRILRARANELAWILRLSHVTVISRFSDRREMAQNEETRALRDARKCMHSTHSRLLHRRMREGNGGLKYGRCPGEYGRNYCHTFSFLPETMEPVIRPHYLHFKSGFKALDLCY